MNIELYILYAVEKILGPGARERKPVVAVFNLIAEQAFRVDDLRDFRSDIFGDMSQ